jgi:predicted secreted protein
MTRGRRSLSQERPVFEHPIVAYQPGRVVEQSGIRVYTALDKQISVTSGEIFIVQLDSNQSTGFTWMIEGDVTPNGLELLGRKYTPTTVAPHTVGSGGHDSWTFKAVRHRHTRLAATAPPVW